MASPSIYPNGLNLAGTVFANGPATLQLAGATFFSGAIQWLDTINGDNANSGTLPELPVKTLAQAVTNSAANGIIVIGAGSSESLSGSQSLALANLSIFGCGTGSSRPRYTCAGAVDMWAVTGAGTWIEGIYFPASTAAATDRIGVNAAAVTVKDCYFECGANDTNSSLNILNVNGNQMRASGCTFVVTASRPNIGFRIAGASTDLVVENCTFDGGSYGWSDYALKDTANTTRIRFFNTTFRNRSDLGFTSTGTTYGLFGVNMDGTSNVLLTA